MVIHRILKRQIKRASDGDDVDYEKVFEMVSQTYEEVEETRQRAERTNATLEEEVMSLNAEIQDKINNHW